MSEPQQPLTPRYRATARMVAAWDLTWDEAGYAVDHTMTGALTLLEESLRELGRVYARVFPRTAKLVAHHPIVLAFRWMLRKS